MVKISSPGNLRGFKFELFRPNYPTIFFYNNRPINFTKFILKTQKHNKDSLHNVDFGKLAEELIHIF